MSALLLTALGGLGRAVIRPEPSPAVSQDRSSVAEAHGQDLLVLAWDAYMGSIQDDRDPEFIAACAAEGARLYRELLMLFPDGLPRKSLLNSDPSSWRAQLFELEHLQVGNRAPALEALHVNGEDARLADYRGRVVVVYLQTTNGPEDDHALLSELVERRKEAPLSVLATRPPSYRGKRYDDPCLIWVVAKSPEQRAQPSIWDIGIPPATIVLDGRGVIRHRALRGQQLVEAVEALVVELVVEQVLPALLLSIP